MSEGAYLGAGVAAFLVCLAVQLGGYYRLLQPALRASEAPQRRLGLRRWVAFLVVWQLLVIAAVVVYAVLAARSHPHGLAWAAPALGAIAGTAIPLQLAVAGISRSALRGGG